MTRICVSKLTIIVPDNGLSPDRRHAIIWNNAGILLIRSSGTNFSEILSEIHIFSFKKMHLKMSSAKWRPFCLGLNVLKHHLISDMWTILRVYTHARARAIFSRAYKTWMGKFSHYWRNLWCTQYQECKAVVMKFYRHESLYIFLNIHPMEYRFPHSDHPW